MNNYQKLGNFLRSYPNNVNIIPTEKKQQKVIKLTDCINIKLEMSVEKLEHIDRDCVRHPGSVTTSL